MRLLILLLFSTFCYSQQQLMPMLLDDEPVPPTAFAGDIQFLFENNTNEEVGNYTVVPNGTFSYVPSVNALNGQAVSLNATQYIDLLAHADFSTTTFTFAFFIMRNAFPSGFDGIVEHDRFGTNWYGIFAASSAGQLDVRASNTGIDNLTTSVSWTMGQWYHIIFTYDGTTGTVYRDGTSILSGAMTAGTANLSALRLFANLEGGEQFFGSIDRFEAWMGESKNASQVSDIYDCANNGTNCNN